MKIVVLGGSPKGEKSITTGYARFMDKCIDGKFEFINIGGRIKKLRNDRDFFAEIMKTIAEADAIIWATPVYYYLVPSQLMDFINLVEERGQIKIFEGKLSTYITTSIHFFDNTAKSYIESVIKSFNMELFSGIQFNMHDIKNKKDQELLGLFIKEFMSILDQPRIINFIKPEISTANFSYFESEITKIKTDKRILILGDYNNSDSSIYNMIDGFKSNFSNINVVDINRIEIKSGCLGCCKCGWDNTCVLKDSDEHNAFFVNNLDKADLIVCAAEIKGEFFSSTWKKFFDRNFFVNHAPRLIGKQFLWLISGEIQSRSYITDMIEGWAQMNQSNFVGYVNDREGDSEYVSRKIDRLAISAVTYAEKNIIKPLNFIGVGGQKIFRDDIFGSLKFPFRNDHKVFKKIGYYDFPHKKIGNRIISKIMLTLGNIKGFRQQVFGNTNTMIDSMYAPC